jgi:predicted nuclease with TOPRIM domain
MLEVLKKKLEALGNEAQSLVGRREQMISAVQEIEVRLHQISGAISELDNLLKSIENKEDKTN